MKCPVCNGQKNEKILDLECGNFDNSPLYNKVRLICCNRCGHFFNKLSSNSISSLMRYYNEEYTPNNLSANKFGGDRPGSISPYSLKRYQNLYNLIKKHLKFNDRVLDGGCASGGFMDFLNKKGFKQLFGIDISSKYLSVAKKTGMNVKLGNVESIPFPDDSFEAIVVDQVLEHLINPNNAFTEAKRILVEGGFFCISVPDASRYQKERFFNFYWFLLREHVQHFDLPHLRLLGLKHGFKLIDYSLTRSPMMSRKMVLPALNIIFRLNKQSPSQKVPMKPKSSGLRKYLNIYIKQEFKIRDHIKLNIRKIIESKKPIYLYGLGRESLYLYELGLKKANIAGLIDDTKFKQQKARIDGKKIYGSDILQHSLQNSELLITAFAHVNKLKSNLKKVGYPGKVIKI